MNLYDIFQIDAHLERPEFILIIHYMFKLKEMFFKHLHFVNICLKTILILFIEALLISNFHIFEGFLIQILLVLKLILII